MSLYKGQDTTALSQLTFFRLLQSSYFFKYADDLRDLKQCDIQPVSNVIAKRQGEVACFKYNKLELTPLRKAVEITL